MPKKEKTIPNPSKISKQEEEFVNEKADSSANKVAYKQRVITVPVSFDDRLTEYLRKYPTEGKRSNFIVRTVANYLDTKTP